MDAFPDMSKDLKFKKEKDLAPVPTDQPGGDKKFDNAVEISAEQMTSKPDSVEVRLQDLKRFKGAWSSNSHQLFKGAKIKHAIEIRIPTTSLAAEKLTHLAFSGAGEFAWAGHRHCSAPV